MPDKKNHEIFLDNLIKRSVWLPDALDICGEHMYPEKWKKGLYHAAIDREKNKSKEDASHISQAVLNKINRLLSDGLLKAFIVNSENNIEHVPVSEWQNDIKIKYYETGKISGAISRKFRPRFKIQTYDKYGDDIGEKIYIRREDLYTCLGIFPQPETHNIFPNSNAGAKIKVPYGKYTAILWAVIEDMNIDDYSKEKLAKKLLTLYDQLWPDENNENHPNSLKKAIIDDFFYVRQNVKNILRAENKK